MWYYPISKVWFFFYTWNVVSTLYPACIMSCIRFINDIVQVNRENQAISILVYIPGTRVLIYLYGAIDVDGPWWHVHKWEWAQIFYYFLELLAPQNVKHQNYFDQLKSMSMWVTNQNALWQGHVWLWCHGFWWWGHMFYDGAIAFLKFMSTIEATKRGPCQAHNRKYTLFMIY